jgi:hypothetical protein
MMIVMTCNKPARSTPMVVVVPARWLPSNTIAVAGGEWHLAID